MTALGGADPGVIKQMKILFVRVLARTFDPYSHCVRTVFPCYTTFRSGGSRLDRQTLHVLEWLSQTHIPGTRSRNTYRSYLAVRHIGAITRTTGFAVHKRKLQTYLRHI